MDRFSFSGKSKDQRLTARASFIPAGAKCILEHSNGSALYTYESGEKPYMVAFWGTSARPMHHYRYTTDEKRQAAVSGFRESVERKETRKAALHAERMTAPLGLQVGDIVNTSWGYDQTNVSFYAVTRLGTRCVWVRPVAQDFEATGSMTGKCWPAMPIRFTGPETRHIAYNGSTSINGHSASITTGPKYFSSYA